MKTIGYRKEGISSLYILTLILGIALFVGGIIFFCKCLADMSNVQVFIGSIILGLILGPVIIGISIYEMVTFYSTNEHVICADEEQISVNGSKFLIKDIIDVSYKEARSRYATYKYGKITIKTKDKTYYAKNVADCEIVSKKITKLVYEKKNID